MPRDRGRPKKAMDRPAPEPRAPKGWTLLLPAAVLVVLNLPCIGLGYFWDDFYFLTFEGHGGFWAGLLPVKDAAFYRPIPLGIYFKVLRFLDPASGLLGHLLNLAALVLVVILLVIIVTRLCGPRAGLFSGLVFASYGQVPGLVGWISCCQDLFAILFVMAAFLLRHRGKDVAALAFATAALLCKEPALAAFPTLLLWDWILGRPTTHPRLQFVGYPTVAFLWACIHPGIQLLAGRGFSSGATGYVGFEHVERWGPYLARYLATLVNLPPPGLIASWWENRAWFGLAALVIMVVALGYLDRQRRSGGSTRTLPLARVALLSAILTIPGVLMPTVLVRHWTPYFACFPALGVAMFLGPALAKQGKPLAIAALATFLLLGIWCRGIRTEGEPVLSERAMAESSSAVRQVRADFRELFPTFPKGSQVVASVGAKGIRGIQSALIRGQALTLWYADPTIRAVRTRERRPGAPAEYFIRITNDPHVLAIDFDPLRVRSTLPGKPNPAEIHRPVNDYARAVAAGGETDRAIRIMESLNATEPEELGLYNHRMIASMLLAAGRRQIADSIMAATPPYPKDVAFSIVLGLLAEPSPSEELDNAAFEAFGLSGTDPDVLRSIMVAFERKGSMEQAAWYALKLVRIVPGDGQSIELLRRAVQMGVTPQREPSIRLNAPYAERA